jgi:hypothetical protein
MLKHVQLDAAQKLTYYGTILATVQCRDASRQGDRNLPELATITRSVQSEIRSAPCEMPTDASIDAKTLGSYLQIASDAALAERVVAVVGRPGWGTKGTTAGALCGAIKNEGIKP